MATNMAELTPVEVMTLAALADGPLHGYGLVQRIEELTDGRMRVRPGNLYRVLNRLESAGLVDEVESGGAEVGERRRRFRLSAKGRREAKAELGMYARVLERFGAVRVARPDA
jgi:DNA-binding PadR family transcriptional regulator